MRNDKRYEIQRAFDLFPHVAGASWAVIWFRLNGIKKPTREEYRKKVLEYFELLEPLFESYPNDEKFKEMIDYINWRKDDAKEKITNGLNKEIEIRYDRYVDYG
jgi:hypothetical protein